MNTIKIHRRSNRPTCITMNWRLFNVAATVWFVVTGGLTGVLLAAIILNEIYPGHPFYVAIRGFLKTTFNL